MREAVAAAVVIRGPVKFHKLVECLDGCGVDEYPVKGDDLDAPARPDVDQEGAEDDCTGAICMPNATTFAASSSVVRAGCVG